MAPTSLPAKIEAAKEMIGQAENDLQRLVTNTAVAPRADKAKPSEVVQAALLKVKTAKAKLQGLEESLATLEVERAAIAKLEAAKIALRAAEQCLDKTLSEIVVVAGADSMVTKAVKDAFPFLEVAKTNLADLDAIAADKTDRD